jgi:hypothetical protein
MGSRDSISRCEARSTDPDRSDRRGDACLERRVDGGQRSERRAVALLVSRARATTGARGDARLHGALPYCARHRSSRTSLDRRRGLLLRDAAGRRRRHESSRRRTRTSRNGSPRVDTRQCRPVGRTVIAREARLGRWKVVPSRSSGDLQAVLRCRHLYDAILMRTRSVRWLIRELYLAGQAPRDWSRWDRAGRAITGILSMT